MTSEPTQIAPRTDGRTVTLPAVRELHYGSGALELAAAQLSAMGEERVFVIASRFSAAAVDRLAGALGDAYAGSFDEVVMHVRRDSVDAGLEAARRAGATALISIGGGTEIDCTKAIALCLACGFGSAHELAAYRVRAGAGAGQAVAPVSIAPPRHLAVPTTLSGAETTTLFGVTDPESSEKHVYSDPSLAPWTVVLDPGVAAGTPDWLWASSGMRAVDHAVESVLSPRAWPLQDAVALEGLRVLRHNLIYSALNPDEVAARRACQLGAWMASYAVETSGVGLSHAIGHQLAPQFDLAHGVTSAIMLPHVMGFNADVTAPALERIASAGWGGGGAQAAVDGIRELAGSLRAAGIATTLSEAGADRPALDAVADRVIADPSIDTNPKPVVRADVMALFAAAWE
ncbi:MAG: hypothetical protein BGO11_19705 [Solirubrobacterales bacterium 70-9]|nr:MAG: hypothetical protein BGO11_19705 [Solirubrobacterales bacterium 70-9]